MKGVTRWWCRRRWTPRQQRRQEGYNYAAGSWRLQEIVVALFVLVATAVYGQESSQRLTLTPLLSLGERYDDNIFTTPTDKQHDFITVLSPGIRAQYLTTAPTIGTQFDFDYRANIEFFADHSSQNNVGHRLSLMLASPLAPSLDVSLRDLLLITEDPLGRNERLSDPTGLRPVSQQQRARTIHNEAEGRVDVRLGGRTSLGELIGNPDLVTATLSYLKDNGDVINSVTVKLTDLNLDPLDVLALAEVVAKADHLMTVEDLLVAYAFSAYLIEGHPKEVSDILHRVSGDKAQSTEVLASVLKMDMPTLEERFERWLSERH